MNLRLEEISNGFMAEKKINLIDKIIPATLWNN